jgi:carbon monoxide dehydrogenase subunit G
MKLEQSFDVQAPIDVVWRALNDLERVAPCLPGASITGHDDDGTYHGEFKVKLGPTTAAYRGTIKITESDEATHTATLSAKGSDKRGQGGASATIVNTLEEVEGVTRVNAVTDFSITGRLARFGRGGMIEDISNKLLRNFAQCLATRLADGGQVAAGEAPPEAAAAPPEPAPEPTGAMVAAGDAAPEEVGAGAPTAPGASAGDVAAGAAAPEAAEAPPAGKPGAAGAEEPPADPPAAAAGAAPPLGAEAVVGDGGATPGAAPAAEPAPAGSARPASGGGALGGGPPPGDSWSSTPPPAAKAPDAPAPAPPPSAEPLNAGGLFFSVLWERIKRFFRGERRKKSS